MHPGYLNISDHSSCCTIEWECVLFPKNNGNWIKESLGNESQCIFMRCPYLLMSTHPSRIEWMKSRIRTASLSNWTRWVEGGKTNAQMIIQSKFCLGQVKIYGQLGRLKRSYTGVWDSWKDPLCILVFVAWCCTLAFGGEEYQTNCGINRIRAFLLRFAFFWNS